MNNNTLQQRGKPLLKSLSALLFLLASVASIVWLINEPSSQALASTLASLAALTASMLG